MLTYLVLLHGMNDKFSYSFDNWFSPWFLLTNPRPLESWNLRRVPALLQCQPQGRLLRRLHLPSKLGQKLWQTLEQKMFHYHFLREIIMRELDKDAIVIVFTHTKMLGPNVNTSWDALPLCSHIWEWLLLHCPCVHWQWQLALPAVFVLKTDHFHLTWKL